MPASSRKRNKGKERKAKKEEIEKARIRYLWQRWTVNEECDHGCTVEILNNHPVSSFLDTLFANAKRKMHAAPNLIDTFPIHPEVWENENNRKTVLDILVRNTYTSKQPRWALPLASKTTT